MPDPEDRQERAASIFERLRASSAFPKSSGTPKGPEQETGAPASQNDNETTQPEERAPQSDSQDRFTKSESELTNPAGQSTQDEPTSSFDPAQVHSSSDSLEIPEEKQEENQDSEKEEVSWDLPEISSTEEWPSHLPPPPPLPPPSFFHTDYGDRPDHADHADRRPPDSPPVSDGTTNGTSGTNGIRSTPDLSSATTVPFADNGIAGILDHMDDEPGLLPESQAIHPGPDLHELPRCFAIANQKGGVGKTTTTVNLGAALAELDYRVLVVDLDPQGNATTGLGVNARNLDASVYDVLLHDVPLEDVIESTTLRNLFVVPATIDLAGAEIELVPVFSRELRLRRALESIDGEFDFILIDCPPSLGLLTINGLAAAGEVIVPIQCEYYALEGLTQLLRNVNLVHSNLNDRLEVSTIVLTMYDGRTRLSEAVADEVRNHFGNRVCRNVIPRTVRLSEAPSFGQPVITFDPSSRGAIAYRELAKEVSGGAPQRTR